MPKSTHMRHVQDGFFFKPASTSTERMKNEVRLLQLLNEGREAGEPMSRFAPRFHGVDSRDGGNYIKLDDLLAAFVEPNLMDVKMGVRCFAEKELKNTKPRT